MAYPLLLAGLALTAAGTGMNMAANAGTQSAVANAVAAEQARQKGFQQAANTVAQKSIAASTEPIAQDQIAQGAQARMNAYTQLAAKVPAASTVALPGQTKPGGAVDTDPTGRAQAEAAATANAWSNAVGGAQARLGGYEDWGLKQNIKNRQASEQIGVQANLSKGSASVLPFEVAAAQHSNDELSGWGQLVSALGSVAMMGAASGMGAPLAQTASPAITAPAWAVQGSGVGTVAVGSEAANPWAGIILNP